MDTSPAVAPPSDLAITQAPAWAPLYAAASGLFTREGRWRRALADQIKPRSGDVILDIGCGAGALAILLAQAAPGATIVGIDPDGAALERAHARAEAAGVSIDFVQGEGKHAAELSTPWRPNKVVSSLVLHQISVREKQAILAAARAALPRGGRLHVADYGAQRTALMRRLFRTVQSLDGFANTEPNALGVLPRLIRAAGFEAVDETAALPTPSGSISLYSARAA